MKFVLAFDSFKGSLTANEVASAALAGIKSVVPDATVVTLGVADGGEGTAATLVNSLHGEQVECETVDPLGRHITARYGIAEVDGVKTAIIDIASASGFTLLSPVERDVMKASTLGTGKLIADALEKGCTRFLIGLGGSATCDGGAGMLAALGARLLDKDGHELAPTGETIGLVESIDTSAMVEGLSRCEFTVMSDVANPLYGPEGAAAVFAPQKGATPVQVKQLDEGLRHWAQVMRRSTGKDVADTPGAGAAGGAGAALLAFFKSDIRPGIELSLELSHFDDALTDADLVITGEGKIDGQSLYGKLPLGVCRRAAGRGVPTVAIAGSVEATFRLLDAGLAGVFPILSHPSSLSEAMEPRTAFDNVAATAASIAKFYVTIRRAAQAST